MSNQVIVASASSKVLLHDLSQAKFSSYSTATSGGTGLQPLPVFSSLKHAGSKINCLAWSHNNQIVASGYDDGLIQLSAAQNGKTVHQI